jgi:arylsulfatase A-like enzyme
LTARRRPAEEEIRMIMRTRAGPARLIPAIILWVAATAAWAGAEPPPRRIVLIVCDTLSARHLAGAGGAAASATLDSLAATGVRFRRCLAPQVWTLTSHMSMLTGLEPGAHGVGAGQALPATIPLLAELLRGAGFACGGFPTANPWLDAAFGFARGFRTYGTLELDQPLGARATAWATEAATAPDGDAPAGLFLFLHCMDVHSRGITEPYPYWPVSDRHQELIRADGVEIARRLTPPDRSLPRRAIHPMPEWALDAYDPAELARAYDVCIRAWDETRLRGTLHALQEAGHLEDALVIVTSDHGEAFGEHGRMLHETPHAEVREVPLVIAWSGRLPAGRVVDEPVSVTDLAPTVLDLCGLPLPEPCQGRSLRSLLAGEDGPPPRDFLIDGHHPGYRLAETALVGQVDGAWWSLVAWTDTTGCGAGGRAPRLAAVAGLFDLAADPTERRDLAAARPDLVAELSRRLQERLDGNAGLARRILAVARPEAVALPEEQRRRLRSLGY